MPHSELKAEGQKNRSPEDFRRIFWVVLLIVIPFGVYWHGLKGPFLLDDIKQIVLNETLQNRDVSLHSIIAAGLSYDPLYGSRFLSMISFWVNCFLGGLNSYLFKLTNLFVHVSTAYAFFHLTLKLLSLVKKEKGRKSSVFPRRDVLSTAFLVCLAWSLHPVNLTAVLYIVQRMTSLAGFFVAAGLLVYIHGRKRFAGDDMRGVVYIALGVPLCTGAAFYCKETGALLPAFAFLLEWFFFRFRTNDSRKRNFLYLFFFITVFFPIFIFIVLLILNPEMFLGGYLFRNYTLYQRLLTEPRVIFLYLKLIIIPFRPDFTLYHDDISVSQSLFDPATTIVSILGLVLLFLSAMWAKGKYPLYSFGVCFFLVGHSIESSLFPLELAFEHRNYVPSFGIILAISSSLVDVSKLAVGRTMAGRLILTCFVIYCGCITYIRSQDWSHLRRLNEIAVTYHPLSSRAHYELGRMYQSVLEYTKSNDEINAKARFHFLEAARLDPANKINGLFSVLFEDLAVRGKADEKIINELTTALSTQPHYASAFRNFGMLFDHMRIEGKGTFPLKTMRKLIEAFIRNPVALPLGKAKVLQASLDVVLQKNNIDLAFEYAQKALEYAPENVDFRLDLATIFIKADDFSGALAELKKIQSQKYDVRTKKRIQELQAMVQKQRSLKHL